MGASGHASCDRLRIVRVEPGQLWLEQDVGPIAVPEQASRIARVGWEINVLASRRKGTWYISEIGNVHPSLAEDEDEVEVDWDIGGEG